MNHAQARAPALQATAMQAVYQFLRESGYVESMRMLEEESGVPHDEESLADRPAHLLTALSDYDEHTVAAIKHKKADPEFVAITQWINSLRDNSEPYVSYEWRKLETHATSNIICCKWQPKPGSHLFAAGSVDKTVAICDAEQNTVLHRVQVSGPVLSLHFNPVHSNLLLATCMNGGHSIVDVSSGTVLFSAVDHKKYAVAGKWNPAGTHYATGSHDNMVHVYGTVAPAAASASASSVSAVDSSNLRWSEVGHVEFASVVESLEWLDASKFYVSVREDNYLHEVRVVGASVCEAGKVNMNESGDDHVSFSVLDMALAPNAKSILLATDRHRVILMQIGSSAQIRNFYGITNDGYSTPRVSWSPSGKFAYVTSQDKCVVVLNIPSGQTVHRLEGHQINVRDVSMHAPSNRLLSCSFDRTCRVWTPALE